MQYVKSTSEIFVVEKVGVAATVHICIREVIYSNLGVDILPTVFFFVFFLSLSTYMLSSTSNIPRPFHYTFFFNSSIGDADSAVTYTQEIFICILCRL
jgi:hypothetical protein